MTPDPAMAVYFGSVTYVRVVTMAVQASGASRRWGMGLT
jgi:hypothetical protein